MTFAQWRNRLTTHFSECIPVDKRRMTDYRVGKMLRCFLAKKRLRTVTTIQTVNKIHAGPWPDHEHFGCSGLQCGCI